MAQYVAVESIMVLVQGYKIYPCTGGISLVNTGWLKYSFRVAIELTKRVLTMGYYVGVSHSVDSGRQSNSESF